MFLGRNQTRHDQAGYSLRGVPAVETSRNQPDFCLVVLLALAIGMSTVPLQSNPSHRLIRIVAVVMRCFGVGLALMMSTVPFQSECF